MAKREKMTYESRVERAKQKIAEKPHRLLQEIGKFLVAEVKKAVPRSMSRRLVRDRSGQLIEITPGRLRKGIGYWARKIEKDLQIGSKTFYAPYLELGTSEMPKEPFLIPTIERNINTIQELAKASYEELNREE